MIDILAAICAAFPFLKQSSVSADCLCGRRWHVRLSGTQLHCLAYINETTEYLVDYTRHKCVLSASDPQLFAKLEMLFGENVTTS